MKKFFLIAALLILAPGGFAQVTDFTVNNYSFETLPGNAMSSCGGSCVYEYGPIPGWNENNNNSGQQNITGYYGAASEPNPPAYDAGDTYDLQVAVLSRTDAPNDALVQLEIGNTVVATAPTTGTNYSGTWSLENAVFTANAGEAGQQLTILLSSSGVQGGFDDVTLTAVPEGGASSLYVLLAGLCCFGAIFASRKQFPGRA
jgi:hypothetical protein